MKGYLYQNEIVEYREHIRHQTTRMELWIPDDRILVSWVLGGVPQVARVEHLPVENTPSSRKKIRDVKIPYATIRVLRDDLAQQHARVNASAVLILAAQQSETRLKRALIPLKLP